MGLTSLAAPGAGLARKWPGQAKRWGSARRYERIDRELRVKILSAS